MRHRPIVRSAAGLAGPSVIRRLVRRTLWRTATRQELWGTGNRESWRNAFLSRQSILLWAWRTHERNRLTFGIISWTGFAQTQVPYHRAPRHALCQDVHGRARFVHPSPAGFEFFHGSQMGFSVRDSFPVKLPRARQR